MGCCCSKGAAPVADDYSNAAAAPGLRKTLKIGPHSNCISQLCFQSCSVFALEDQAAFCFLSANRRQVRVVSSATCQLLLETPPYNENIGRCFSSANGILALLVGSNVRIWSLLSGKPLSSAMHGSVVSTGCLSQDWLATAEETGSISIWQPNSQWIYQPKSFADGFPKGVIQLFWLQQPGRKLLVVGLRCGVQIVHGDSGGVLWTWAPGKGGISSSSPTTVPAAGASAEAPLPGLLALAACFVAERFLLLAVCREEELKTANQAPGSGSSGAAESFEDMARQGRALLAANWDKALLLAIDLETGQHLLTKVAKQAEQGGAEGLLAEEEGQGEGALGKGRSVQQLGSSESSEVAGAGVGASAAPPTASSVELRLSSSSAAHAPAEVAVQTPESMLGMQRMETAQQSTLSSLRKLANGGISPALLVAMTRKKKALASASGWFAHSRGPSGSIDCLEVAVAPPSQPPSPGRAQTEGDMQPAMSTLELKQVSFTAHAGSFCLVLPLGGRGLVTAPTNELTLQADLTAPSSASLRLLQRRTAEEMKQSELPPASPGFASASGSSSRLFGVVAASRRFGGAVSKRGFSSSIGGGEGGDAGTGAAAFPAAGVATAGGAGGAGAAAVAQESVTVKDILSAAEEGGVDKSEGQTGTAARDGAAAAPALSAGASGVHVSMGSRLSMSSYGSMRAGEGPPSPLPALRFWDPLGPDKEGNTLVAEVTELPPPIHTASGSAASSSNSSLGGSAAAVLAVGSDVSVPRPTATAAPPAAISGGHKGARAAPPASSSSSSPSSATAVVSMASLPNGLVAVVDSKGSSFIINILAEEQQRERERQQKREMQQASSR